MSKRTPRPPLAEVDTWELWLALRAGRVSFVLPWVLLLAGFCAVLAGMAAFFWLTTRETPDDRLFLGAVLLALSFFLWRRLSTRPGFSLALLLAMLTLTGILFGLWLLGFAAGGENVWIGILGVVLTCALGIVLGMIGIRGLTPPNAG